MTAPHSPGRVAASRFTGATPGVSAALLAALQRNESAPTRFPSAACSRSGLDPAPHPTQCRATRHPHVWITLSGGEYRGQLGTWARDAAVLPGAALVVRPRSRTRAPMAITSLARGQTQLYAACLLLAGAVGERSVLPRALSSASAMRGAGSVAARATHAAAKSISA